MAAIWVRRLTLLCYRLAGMGAILFGLSWPLHSRVAFLGGVGLMVCAVLMVVPVYLADREPRTRLLNISSATWAVLFVVWCLAWLAVPLRLHLRWVTLIGGIAFFVSSCVLVYLHWLARRREKARAPR
jgi:hypothetical protein